MARDYDGDPFATADILEPPSLDDGHGDIFKPSLFEEVQLDSRSRPPRTRMLTNSLQFPP